jgi:hypothetical protein
MKRLLLPLCGIAMTVESILILSLEGQGVGQRELKMLKKLIS